MDKIDSFATGVLSMLAIAVSINLLVKRSKKSDLVKNITELAKNQDTPALVDMIVLPGDLRTICIYGSGETQKIFLRSPDNTMVLLVDVDSKRLHELRIKMERYDATHPVDPKTMAPAN